MWTKWRKNATQPMNFISNAITWAIIQEVIDAFQAWVEEIMEGKLPNRRKETLMSSFQGAGLAAGESPMFHHHHANLLILRRYARFVLILDPPLKHAVVSPTGALLILPYWNLMVHSQVIPHSPTTMGTPHDQWTGPLHTAFTTHRVTQWDKNHDRWRYCCCFMGQVTDGNSRRRKNKIDGDCTKTGFASQEVNSFFGIENAQRCWAFLCLFRSCYSVIPLFRYSVIPVIPLLCFSLFCFRA